MNHEVYQQYISQYIDGELNDALENNLFLHLGSCRECRDFLKSSIQMQNDIVAAKPRATVDIYHQVFEKSVLGDKPPVALSVGLERNQRRMKTQFPAMVLLAFMLMVGGLLFSTKVEVKSPQEVSAVPSGMSFPDNSFKR